MQVTDCFVPELSILAVEYFETNVDVLLGNL